jgi:1-acyl-sn-glycerol-3-phosphate acyltransferase
MPIALLTRFRVRGRDNVPRQGPLIVVSNHLNLFDPFFIWAGLGRRAVFIAKEELFRPRLVGCFMGMLGSFPVSKGRLDRKTFRQTMQLLTDSQALVIFPEGMRSQNGRLKPAFPGAALVAQHSGAPIIPIGITGSEKLKGLSWLWHRPEITVNIGQAFTLPPVNNKLTKEELAKFTDSIMLSIARLVPHKYRGHYANKENRRTYDTKN